MGKPYVVEAPLQGDQFCIEAGDVQIIVAFPHDGKLWCVLADRTDRLTKEEREVLDSVRSMDGIEVNIEDPEFKVCERLKELRYVHISVARGPGKKWRRVTERKTG